jgi:aminopeptidase N
MPTPLISLLLLQALAPPPASPSAPAELQADRFAESIRESHRRIREAHKRSRRPPRLSSMGAERVVELEQESFDVLHYSLALTIDPENASEYINGHVDILLEPTGPSLDQVELNLDDRLSVSRVRRASGDQIFTQENDVVVITLSPPLSAGEQATLRVIYAGSPNVSDWDSFDIDRSRSFPVVWTNCEPEGSRNWWPCKDRPDDKATVDLSITMDSDYVVASNGLLNAIDDNGDGTATTTWETSYPLATYLVAITATDYVLFENSYSLHGGGDLPLTFYTYPENEIDAREDVTSMPEMLDIYETNWLPYPFATEKYGHMEYPWGGAMEHSTLTSYGSGLYTGDHYFDWIIAHELAHQWWGDMVTCGTWADIWLNEGFATYGEAIWTEGKDGYDAYLFYMQTLKSSSFAGPIYDPYYTFNSTVYDKGAWVLHMLRGIVGRETLMSILQTWGTRYANESAITDDFVAVASEIAGEDLGWFFTPWLYEAGRPLYEYSYDLVPDSGAEEGTTILLELEQVQAGYSPYRMPLTFRFPTSSGGYTDTTVVNATEQESYVFHAPGFVIGVEPDPEGYVLARFRRVPWVGISDGAPEPAVNTTRLGNPAPNPFNPRTIIPVEMQQNGRAELRIHDLAGREVRRLFSGELAGGKTRFTWDGTNDQGISLPSGVYFVRLETGTAPLQTRKLLLLK